MTLKRFVFYCITILLLLTACQQSEKSNFYVKGRHLYSPCGEKVVLRGVNKMIIWRDIDGDTAFPEIAKSGANVVRIVWNTSGTAEQLDTAISGCIAQQMIPMIECHDATGKWTQLPKIIDYWTNGQVVTVIKKHQKYLLLNIANECGEASVPPDTFRTVYTRVVKRMRETGIHVPLIIDGTDWGKDIDVLQSQGPALIAADPDQNLMFSIHMWWPAAWGYDEQRVIDELQECVDLELPIIVGEFGHMWDETDEGQIPYKTILAECQKHEIGWLAWSWGPGNNPQTFLDMTTDGTYGSLHGWGKEVVDIDPNSIRHTSVRPFYILNDSCK